MKEAIIAIWLDRMLTKKQLLEIYLNIVEFGEGVYGISEASSYYFGKSIGDLTLKESCFLIILLPNPQERGESYFKCESTFFATKMMNRHFYSMLKQGRIDIKTYDLALCEELWYE